MDDTKKPLAGGNQTRGAVKAFQSTQRRSATRRHHTIKGAPAVKFYSDRGVETNKRYAAVGNPNPSIRGSIAGWSAASRRRMRRVLLSHQAPTERGYGYLGLTYTIPGPVMDPSEANALWTAYARKAARMGVGLIWRLEIQGRGQLHWHCLASVDIAEMQRNDLEQRLVFLWLDMLGDRGKLLGALRHAVHVEGGDVEGNSVWLRYLQDHASKRKQGQVAANMGRHWGVVGRKHWHVVEPVERRMTDRQVNHVVRALQRWATPRIKDNRVPWGHRLGWRLLRGARATGQWFCNPDLVARLCDWAIACYPE